MLKQRKQIIMVVESMSSRAWRARLSEQHRVKPPHRQDIARWLQKPAPADTVSSRAAWACLFASARAAFLQRALRTPLSDQRSGDGVKARPSNRAQNRPPPSEPILPSSLVDCVPHDAGSRESGGAPALSDCERLALWTAVVTMTSVECN